MTKATSFESPEKNTNGSYIRSMIIIGALFFIFGFITWLNSVLIPYLQIACELNEVESYLVTFAFYISYLVMAIPSSWLLRVIGFKNGMSVGLIVIAIGALIFIPAAMTRIYSLFLVGLFVQGTGLAILQTASNPYVTILGPIESAARRISIMGVCNKIAGAIAPIILGAIALDNADGLKKKLLTMDAVQKAIELDALAARVIIPYLVIMGLLILLSIMIYFSGLPEIDTEKEDENLAVVNTNKKSIFQFPHVMLGVLALFLYVGAEVIAGDTIIKYGAFQGIPFSTAKFFTTCTLIAMLVGYVAGIATIPKLISQQTALKISAILGVVFSSAAIFSSGYISVFCIALLGLANALVWPAIWPLALADVGRFTKIASSLLIMAIAGGALLPLLYGYLVDHKVSPQQSYWILIPCYLFILYYSMAGHKIRTK